MERSICVFIIIFFWWTVTSFICHFCAKLFLTEASIASTQVYRNTLYLTGMQTATILVSMLRENNNENARTKFAILSMHICATIATNWSIAISHAASTFAIKLMEPLTGAFAQRLILGVKLSYIQCISIPLVIIGAVVFADDSNQAFVSISLGSILAFNSNIFLAFRNVYIKQKHLSNTNLFLSDTKLISDVVGISTVGIMFLSVFTKHDILSNRFCYLYLLVLISAVFHTIYTYISTVLVLKHFSVVGHAFGNIMKRLLVITLLYIVGSRRATTWNLLGIIICTVGLVLYAGSKVESTNDIKFGNKSSYGLSDLSRRTKVLIASTVIIMLLLTSQLPPFKSLIKDKLLSGAIIDKTGFNHPLLEEKVESKVYQLSLNQSLNFSLEEFYATDLTKYPEEANKISPFLTKREDVITEAQRIHMNIFSRLLKGYRYAMLLEYAEVANRGDSAITVGEATLLRKFNITIIFACSVGKCRHQLNDAEKMSEKYSNNELVILFHGGGNIIEYPQVDKVRFDEISHFKAFNIIMFPQGILYQGKTQHIELCKKVLSSHASLTFIWRDTVSYRLGKKLFPKVRSLLSPDTAYAIGPVKRFMDPTHDILWMKQTDNEGLVYDVLKSAGDYRIHVADWTDWSSPKGTSPMENSYLLTTTGLMFLARGRVLVTDRLHGYIMSTLLDIPLVFIDDTQHKISNYHKTWTQGLENIVFAISSEDALVQAKYFIKKLDKELPKISGYFKNTGY